jgi:hypothetical protein
MRRPRSFASIAATSPPRMISATRRHALFSCATLYAGPRERPKRSYGAYELLPLFISESGRRKVTWPCSASSAFSPTRKASPLPWARSRGVSPVSSGATESIAALPWARASASRYDSQWKLDSLARHEMK